MKTIIRNQMFPLISLFDDFFENRTSDEVKQSMQQVKSCQMPVDIVENEREYKVLANLPGIAKNDVKISYLEGQMTIETVEREAAKTEVETEQKVLNCERYCGTYHRSLYLPENIEAEKINAKMENGVLTVIIPKIEPKKHSFIEIK